MTSDDYSETPEGMAEEAKAFEDWEDAFIARNREAIGRMIQQAQESASRGECREWDLEDFLARGERRYAEYLAGNRD